MKFSVVASLAKWTARVPILKARHVKAQRALRRARKADVHPRQHLVDARDKASDDLRHARDMVKLRAQQLASEANAVWHPGAKIVRHSDAGPFTGGGRKLVWHTTQGSGLPNYQGSAPHFTINLKTGQIWQHIPIDRAAKTLKAGGPNFWNAIQVEIIGFAEQASTWTPAEYVRLRDLARWIERNGDVPRKCTVVFTDSQHVKRLPAEAFKAYTGHIGHQHAPGNDHWDPGKLNIKEVLR